MNTTDGSGEYQTDPQLWVEEADSVYRCKCGHPLGQVLRVGTFPEYGFVKTKRLLLYRDEKPIAYLIGYGVVCCEKCGEWSQWVPKTRKS